MRKMYKYDDDPDIYILTSILRDSYDDAMKRIAIPESVSAHKEFDDLLNL